MTPRLFALRTANERLVVPWNGGRRRERGAARRLDADHVGAQVGEEAAARLALLVGHVDHAQAGERRLGRRVSGLPERRLVT